MSQRRTESGFTLVEIMITVAVIAILAAIALPSYQDFTIRTKVTECLTLSSAAKLAVALEVGREGNATGQATVPGSFDPSRYCGDISVSATGEILMTTHNTGASEDPVLQLTPTLADGRVSWTCGLVGGSARHVPAECRENALASNLPVGPSPAPPSAPPPWTPPPPPDQDPAPTPPGTPPEPAPPGNEPPGAPPSAPSDPTPPSGPTPPSDPPPPIGSPEPAPAPPSDPGPTPPPAGAPPVDDPPSAPPPPDYNDHEEGSREWCQLHPEPPGKCNKFK